MNYLQKLIDDAPEKATHVDFNNHYWHNSSAGYWLICDDGSHDCEDMLGNHVRSLTDLKKTLALEKESAELKASIPEIQAKAVEDVLEYAVYTLVNFKPMYSIEQIKTYVNKLRSKAK